MKNKKVVILLEILILSLFFISNISAQGLNLKMGKFAYPGTDLILRFLSDGTVQGISNINPNMVLAIGRYNVNGNRLTVTFNDQANGNWKIVAGKTYVYIIDDDETFSGNGEQWVRIGN